MEKQLYYSVSLNILFYETCKMLDELRCEFVTPELMLLALLRQKAFCKALAVVDIDADPLAHEMYDYVKSLDTIPDGEEYHVAFSAQTLEMLDLTMEYTRLEKLNFSDVQHLIGGMLRLEDSHAAYALKKRLGDNVDNFCEVVADIYSHLDMETEAGRFYDMLVKDHMMEEFIKQNDNDCEDDEKDMPGFFKKEDGFNPFIAKHEWNSGGTIDDMDWDENDVYDLFETQNDKTQQSMFNENGMPTDEWHQHVTDLTAQYDSSYSLLHPCYGREEELERTIQVLCRKDKCNPIFVGEPGVGKTTLIHGLVDLIGSNKVPQRLRSNHIYRIDVGTLVAGTQYRGDFEKRIKLILDGAAREGNTILYIDEIHNLVGAGRTSEGSLDAADIFKPYLEDGSIKFIGSTTYTEYNKYFLNNRGLVRRFQQIDIKEPSPGLATSILKDTKYLYEIFHQVKIMPSAIEYAVRMSDKYIKDRFLPDKAIDIIDEAAAYREIHPEGNEEGKQEVVDKALVNEILTRVCKIDAAALKDNGNAALKDLKQRISAQIYGQDRAVEDVTLAVETAKAGLGDDTKPLASLLFVGPTGVGKTEVAKVLAHELGISLVRFDMSEYTEKHTVAKLIGSPAGYVGYEEGGLLTDAIRKTPNCVLLLDEIEKAHPDIYNILLQVMDYASLTDNKGRKSDFRNVILIMTSNAGAQYAHQTGFGFASRQNAGDAMLKQVKKTFKPEFVNRLSAIAVFNDMDEHMARLILGKKLGELQAKLEARRVKLTLTPEAEDHLLKLGFSPVYGAREIERVIGRELRPQLVKEILFGKLKRGGKVTADLTDGSITLSVKR